MAEAQDAIRESLAAKGIAAVRGKIMFRRERDEIVFECEVCEITETFEDVEFETAWFQLRRKGWRCQKVGTEWIHGCPLHAKQI